MQGGKPEFCALHRKCCLSINGACATPDPISFVNRKVATWIRTQKGRYGERDDSNRTTVGIRVYAKNVGSFQFGKRKRVCENAETVHFGSLVDP